jgi:hypothetical protein
MSCSQDVCINAAGETVANSLAEYTSQYEYMIKYQSKPPSVTTSLSYYDYLRFVNAQIALLQAKTAGYICEKNGSCTCKKPAVYYPDYKGSEVAGIVPAITVCQRDLSSTNRVLDTNPPGNYNGEGFTCNPKIFNATYKDADSYASVAAITVCNQNL